MYNVLMYTAEISEHLKTASLTLREFLIKDQLK